MRLALVLVAVAGLAAPFAEAQPAAQSAPAGAGGLFGEREPGEDDQAIESGQRPPATASPDSAAYDARVRDSFKAAEAFQGPLDGGWTLAAENDGAIFDLRFVDSKDRLEAVWRDLRRKGALDASGTVDQVRRLGDTVTLSFHSRPGVADFVSLAPARGGYAGELTEAGKTRPVWLARNGP